MVPFYHYSTLVKYIKSSIVNYISTKYEGKKKILRFRTNYTRFQVFGHSSLVTSISYRQNQPNNVKEVCQHDSAFDVPPLPALRALLAEDISITLAREIKRRKTDEDATDSLVLPKVDSASVLSISSDTCVAQTEIMLVLVFSFGDVYVVKSRVNYYNYSRREL
ncbi:hypothetical protein ACJMK2_026710 [Sinanodonta woodiana]|uniref:Uncharacterized protein n=1 Tax=Sinanodonta woodiana TaxID=1069815 RepID=A0ABD3XNV3_SINWO